MQLKVAQKAAAGTKSTMPAVLRIFDHLQGVFFDGSKSQRKKFGMGIAECLTAAEIMVFNQLMLNDNLDVQVDEKGERQIVFEKDPERRRDFDIAQLTQEFKMQEIIAPDRRTPPTRRLSLTIPHTTALVLTGSRNSTDEPTSDQHLTPRTAYCSISSGFAHPPSPGERAPNQLSSLRTVCKSKAYTLYLYIIA